MNTSESFFNQHGLYLASFVFGLSLIHSFLVNKIEHFSHSFSERSLLRKIFHYLAEVEVVFGVWSILLFLILIITYGKKSTLLHFTSLNFSEAKFVAIIMLVAGTRPVVNFAEKFIIVCSRLLIMNSKRAFFFACLIIGPLLGSFITEPAAMAVTSLILAETIFKKNQSTNKFKYAVLALLLVNISIGGTLTHFAAPPVVMVASKWNWGTGFMFSHFGYKAIISIILSTIVYGHIFKNELIGEINFLKNERQVPFWIFLCHLAFIVLTIFFSHQCDILVGIVIFFLGFTSMTRKYQDPLKLKSSILVGFFLAGLIYLGSFQSYWINELILNLSSYSLNIGATLLTSIADNALITYLASLSNLTDLSKYFLVAGAVAGGGLTVIANAPNPIGVEILKKHFEEDGINFIDLFLWALIPTIIAGSCFLFLPSFNF